jgi:LiaF transmembrane domain
MRIRRGLLFWGLFLIPMGVVPLLVRAGVVSEDVFSDIWRWWPLALIGVGVALLVRRSQAGLIGTAIVALVLGTLVGSALASGNWWIGGLTECASSSNDATVLDREGSFDGGASVTVELDCGSLDISTQPGTAWQVHAAYRGPEPNVTATGTSLSLGSPDSAGIHRQEWTVAVGADALRDLGLKINAAASTVTLAGAALASLDADVNAGDLRIDGSGATIEAIDAAVNAGRLRVVLVGPTRGELSANAGAIELCVPPDAQLELDAQDQFTFATNLDSRGLTHDGDTWTRPGTGGLIELSIEGNAASFTLDPDGGCQ